MRTALEIPDALFCRAESAAAAYGIPLQESILEALAERLGGRGTADKPRLKTFGKLRRLRKETARISRIIEEGFSQITPPALVSRTRRRVHRPVH
jgi:hypothetical protein